MFIHYYHISCFVLSIQKNYSIVFIIVVCPPILVFLLTLYVIIVAVDFRLWHYILY